MNKQNIKPCIYCTFAKDCEAKKMFEAIHFYHPEANAYISGLSVSCKKYFTQFQPGDRITIYINAIDPFHEDEEMDGIVIMWSRRKIMIVFNEDIEINGKERRIAYLYPRKEYSPIEIYRTGENIGIDQVKALERRIDYETMDIIKE